jgi:hypothetical protein
MDSKQISIHVFNEAANRHREAFPMFHPLDRGPTAAGNRLIILVIEELITAVLQEMDERIKAAMAAIAPDA